MSQKRLEIGLGHCTLRKLYVSYEEYVLHSTCFNAENGRDTLLLCNGRCLTWRVLSIRALYRRYRFRLQCVVGDDCEY